MLVLEDPEENRLGECQKPLTTDNDNFCFVNEDSTCEKLEIPSKPGTFVAIKPCKKIQTSRRTFGFIDTIGGALGFDVDYEYDSILERIGDKAIQAGCDYTFTGACTAFETLFG